MIQYRNDDSRTKRTVPISPCDIYPETFPASPTSWILCRVPKCCFEYSFMHRLFDAARLHSEHRNSHLRKMIAYFSPALSTCCADVGEGGEISRLVVLEIKYRAQWDSSGSLGALFISGSVTGLLCLQLPELLVHFERGSAGFLKLYAELWDFWKQMRTFCPHLGFFFAGWAEQKWAVATIRSPWLYKWFICEKTIFLPMG